MIDLTPIVNAFITLIGLLLTTFLIPWIRTKISNEKLKEIQKWTAVGVKAAEMIYNESGMGWLLEKFGSLFSTYRRGKAGEYEYRVQVKEAGIDRLTYIAELTEFGIEEVGSVGDLLVLRKKADGTPFDLYSDLDSLIAQQKKAVRYLRAGLLLSLGWMSITLMNILMTLMNANVIGKYAGMAAISFRSSQVFLLAASALLLPICIVGIVDCPRGLRRAKQKIAALEAERVIQE